MTTGEKIRTRRKALGMSVDELAAKVGKNRATIYRYESDAIEMPASMLRPLAEALNVAPDDLMDWDLVLHEVTEHDKKMEEALSLVADGISTGGSSFRHLLFKTPIYGGNLEHDLKDLLSLLCRINRSELAQEMHDVRVLAELVIGLDAESVKYLISYGEYLSEQFQRKAGEDYELPYQREQSTLDALN